MPFVGVTSFLAQTKLSSSAPPNLGKEEVDERGDGGAFLPPPIFSELLLPGWSVLKSLHLLQGFQPDEGQQAGAAQPTDGLLYTTPQQLLRLEENDLPGLEWRIKQLLDHIREIWVLNPDEERFQQALKHIHETGGLRPSNLQLPNRTFPPTSLQYILGFEGGALNPHNLGVGCTVVPPEQGRGKDYTKGDFHFKAVPSPPPFPPRPPARHPESPPNW